MKYLDAINRSNQSNVLFKDTSFLNDSKEMKHQNKKIQLIDVSSKLLKMKIVKNSDSEFPGKTLTKNDDENQNEDVVIKNSGSSIFVAPMVPLSSGLNENESNNLDVLPVSLKNMNKKRQ